jgi:hypothetical protein
MYNALDIYVIHFGQRVVVSGICSFASVCAFFRKHVVHYYFRRGVGSGI